MSQLSRRLGFPKEFGKDGGLYLLYGDDLHYISEHNKTAYISTIDKTIQVIDLTDETAPKVTAQYATPNYVGSVTPARYDKLIYVGLLGSIVVIDPAKAILTSESLIKAHAEALRLYQSKKKKYDFKPIRNAIHLLKAAGIDQALEKKPSGISDRALAGILNDYGFFLTKGHRDNEAINMYKRAIQLDPGRAIAYLNLGDSLRNQLSGVGAFNEKIELTKEIKLAYLQYKKLTR
jgi:tetratricopeptide (TPR) repeat protein